MHLDALPAFEKVCEASGGYGERVEDPAELPAALARAIEAVDQEAAPGAPQRDLRGAGRADLVVRPRQNGSHLSEKA